MMRKKVFLKKVLPLCAMLATANFPMEIVAASKKVENKKNDEGYAINFDNVSIKEFLKFISKIGEVNVIYNEEDLNFNVTIISEEPTTLENIMSALVQVLRIHGLMIIEENQNLLIHKNDAVKQIPTVVSAENPWMGKMPPTIMTKVFRIAKGNPTHIASLLTPMLSTSAVVEVSTDTRQLIITDVASSIATVEKLLLSLDVPETPYDVEMYKTKNMSANELAALASKILLPISQNTALQVIPQTDGQTIYIVSTPFLIEKAISVLKEIDNIANTFTIYSPKYVTPQELQTLIHQTDSNLKLANISDPAFMRTLESVKVLPSGQLIFTGDQESLKKIDDVLKELDQVNLAGREGETVQFFRVQDKNPVAIVHTLHEIANQLKDGDAASRSLINSLNGAQAIAQSNLIIASGTPSDLAKIQDLINTSETNQLALEGPYFIQLKYATIDRIRNALNRLAEDLPKNSPIREMIRTMHYLPDSHALVFKGSREAMQRVKEVIDLTDSPTNLLPQTSHEVVFYQAKNVPATQLVKLLKETGHQLANNPDAPKSLVNTFESAEILPGSNTLIISGAKENTDKVQSFLTANDTPAGGVSTANEVYVYRLKYLSAKELHTALMGIASHVPGGAQNDDLVKLAYSIETMRPIPDSNAVQFVGSPQTLAKIKDFIAVLDTSEHATQSKGQLGTNFLVYKVQHANPQDLLAHLKQITTETTATGEDSLLKAIRSGRYSPGSNALVFTGNQADLAKIQTLLERLDVTSPVKPSPGPARKVEGYEIYAPHYVSGLDLIQMVKDFEQHLVAAGVIDSKLSETIDHLSYEARTNSLIITGTPEDINKVVELLQKFDTENAANHNGLDRDIETINDTGFLIYKLQHQDGTGIVEALNRISTDLASQKNQQKNAGLIEAIQSVQLIEVTNSLIATGEPNILTKLKELIESIDRPLKQVFIEILVIETSGIHDLEFGLRWSSQGKVEDRFSWGTGNFGSQDGGLANGGGGFATNLNNISGSVVPTGQDIPPINGGYMGVIGDIIWHKGKSYAALGSLLNALRSDGDATVVLSQKIVVQDNQNAKIFSGDNVPFTGSLVTTSGLSQTTNANLEYRNIGVTLSITPLIGDNGLITIDIDEEISEEVNAGDQNTTNVTTRTINGIRTSKTSMLTRVNMPDQHFLVLSGTMRNQVTRSTSGIPCLGGLPLIGAAFTSTKKLTVNRNVVIFVKPHIIQTPQIYDKITRDQEALYGSRELTVPEDFQRGLELIRSPEDHDRDYDGF